MYQQYWHNTTGYDGLNTCAGIWWTSIPLLLLGLTSQLRRLSDYPDYLCLY